MEQPLFTLVQSSVDPRVEFGLREIERALQNRGYTFVRQRLFSLTLPGHLIVVGAIEDLGTIAHPVIVRPPSSPESYSIRVHREAERLVVGAIGHDPTGAMYAALDLAETVDLTGTLTSLAPKDVSPYLAVRGIKLNIPLEGAYSRPMPTEEASNRRWFFDVDFWQHFVDMLARNRYNTLTLWSGHPFHFMLHLKKYPEASDLSPEQIEANIGFFRRVFDLCQSRGISIYLITWNIHVSEAFARKYGVARHGDESALVQDYVKECITALLETYPSLSGIGTCAGEAMRPIGRPGAWNNENIRWNERWVRTVYGDTIRRLGRSIPFIHRSWCTRPRIFREEFACHYDGQIFVEQKFNGEQMFSLPQPHCFDPEWLTVSDKNVRLLWHLRNDAIHLFRWGDPAFVRETVRSCATTGAAGFLWGSEEGRYGTDPATAAVWTGIVGTAPDGQAFHTPATQWHVRWRYEFEKFWFLYQLWGRLGYEPDLPVTLWEQHFRRRYGQAGPQLYQALVAASAIVPVVTAFHWNYMNGDWDPEFCDGPWNTGQQFRLTRGRRHFGVFHTVFEFIFNHTLDERWLNIPDYVHAVVTQQAVSPYLTTPVDVAARLETSATIAAKQIEGISSADEDGPCLVADIQALSALGHYYAEKIRGATELMLFLRTADRTHHSAAVSHLNQAAAWWERLVALAGDHYQHPTHDWRVHQEAARYDAELARRTIPPPPMVW